MTRFQRLASAASLFAFLGLGSVAVAHAAPEQATLAQGAHARHGGGHHGRGDLLRASLHLDSLTTAQREQIEALVSQEKVAHANIATARGQLLQAVADRVAAGSVDDTALSANVQAVEGAIAADEPGDRAALEKLHAILTPAQRVELVTRIESHKGRRDGNAGKEEGERAGRDAGEHHGNRGLGGLGRELNLTDAQKEQIKVNLRSIGPAADQSVAKEARDARQHVLESFKGDRFVMSEVAPPRDPRAAEQQVGRIVRLAKASAPVLTPEQRVMAAAKLREAAARATK